MKTNVHKKLFNYLLLCSVFSILACQDDAPSNELLYTFKDTVPPTITLLGKPVDTTYLQITFLDPEVSMVNGAPKWQHSESTEYVDVGVSILDEVQGVTKCPDEALVEVSGRVNNKITGTYYLTYNGRDSAGNRAAAVTRTVHVVENAAGFINGVYTVECNCTAVNNISGQTTKSSETYTAIAVASAKLNNTFDLSMLRIGPETVKPIVSLKENAMVVEYTCFSAELVGSWDRGSGTLSSDKNSFVINTTARPWNGQLTYSCTNLFTRKKGPAVSVNLNDKSILPGEYSVPH